MQSIESRDSQAPRLSFRIMGLAVALVVFLSYSSAALAADVGDADVGDAVQFKRAGQTFTGKVVGVRPGGKFLEVETTVNGRSRKLIVIASSVTPIAGANAGEMRTWRDASGRFEIEATLESQTAFDVVLRKKDGSSIKVPLDKLSVTDQEYIAGLESGGDDANPFAGGGMGASGPSSDSGVVRSGAGGRSFALPTPQVFRKSPKMQVQKLSAPEELIADPTLLDFSKIGNAAMALPKPEGREEVGRPVVISEDGTQLCYSVRSNRSADTHFTNIRVIDGEKSTTKRVARLEGHSVWLSSADPSSGDVLGIVMKQGEDRGKSLCVLSGVRNGNPQIVAHWKMFPDDENKTDHVRYRKILGNQIAIVVYGGQVHAFDYGTKREVWTLPAGMFNEPAVTPGGKYLSMLVDKQCVVVETKTGKQIGSIPTNMIGSVCMGFSADGLRLAVAQGNQVRMYDVATGKEQLTHEANVPLSGMGKPVLWLEDQFLLLPMGLLLHLERNLIVWKYIIDQDALEYVDLEHHGLITFAGRDSTSIVRLPHDTARKAAERDTTNIAAVKAGDAIAVYANATAPGITPGDVANSLATATTNSGYVVSQSSPNQLLATITRGKTKSQSYRTMGRGFGTEQVSFTPYTSKVEMKQNGVTLWQQSRTTSMPFMIHGNKSLQQTAREYEKPDAKFFQSIRLPAQILKPEFQSGFGSSRVSGTGIVDLNR